MHHYGKIQGFPIDVWTSGLRFDVSAIFLLNAIFFIVILIPFRSRKVFSSLKYLMLIVNSLFWALSLGDIPFYTFTQKRMQADVFQFFTGTKQTDIGNLLPLMLKEHFSYLVIWFIMVIVALLFLKRFEATQKTLDRKSYFSFSGVFFVFLVLNVIAIRGGLQLRPLNPIHAVDHVDIDYAPSVLNSTFTILRSAGKKELPVVDKSIYDGFTNYEKGYRLSTQDNHCMSQSNVVIIVVESLSWEYLSKFGGTGFTPFLDSLADRSLLFTKAYANGRESVQGIPAILASIPSWHDEAFIFSKYNTNHFNSLASLLRGEGYTSAFIHGARRGSMGFESFSRLAKFDQYHGREDYGNDNHYDGTWGIWDHHMLDYTKRLLDTIPQPFFATYFTLNPHHPFAIPEPWNSTFKVDKKHAVIRSLKYVDASLKAFFENVKASPWYENTLFVITADHIGPVTSIMHTKGDDYRIPLFIFHPGHPDFFGVDNKVVNQIDIMPSILDLVNYPKPFFSIGSSFFESENRFRFNMNYRQNLIMCQDSLSYSIWNDEKCISWFETDRDRLLRKNRAKAPSSDIKRKMLKKQIEKSRQLYFYTMQHDLMHFKSDD
jgi:phosphoglycerol transferase MdoB-like AlkP superfamily enzyme